MAPNTPTKTQISVTGEMWSYAVVLTCITVFHRSHPDYYWWHWGENRSNKSIWLLFILFGVSDGIIHQNILARKLPFSGANHLQVSGGMCQISGFYLCLQVSNKYLHWWRTPLVGSPWAVWSTSLVAVESRTWSTWPCLLLQPHIWIRQTSGRV